MPDVPSNAIVPAPSDADRQLAAARTDPAAQDREDLIGWIIDYVANECMTPGPLGKSWPGRGAVLAAVMAEKNLPLVAADELILAAHSRMIEGVGGEDERAALKFATRTRLVNMRRRIEGIMRNPVIKTWYKAEEDASGKKVMRASRETREDPPVLACMDLQLKIDAMIAEIDGLTHVDARGDESVRQIMEEVEKLEKDNQGETRTTVRRSIAQSIRGKDLSELAEVPAAAQMLKGARRKSVRSRVKKADDDDFEDRDEE